MPVVGVGAREMVAPDPVTRLRSNLRVMVQSLERICLCFIREFGPSEEEDGPAPHAAPPMSRRLPDDGVPLCPLMPTQIQSASSRNIVPALDGAWYWGRFLPQHRTGGNNQKQLGREKDQRDVGDAAKQQERYKGFASRVPRPRRRSSTAQVEDGVACGSAPGWDIHPGRDTGWRILCLAAHSVSLSPARQQHHNGRSSARDTDGDDENRTGLAVQPIAESDWLAAGDGTEERKPTGTKRPQSGRMKRAASLHAGRQCVAPVPPRRGAVLLRRISRSCAVFAALTCTSTSVAGRKYIFCRCVFFQLNAVIGAAERGEDFTLSMRSTNRKRKASTTQYPHVNHSGRRIVCTRREDRVLMAHSTSSPMGLQATCTSSDVTMRFIEGGWSPVATEKLEAIRRITTAASQVERDEHATDRPASMLACAPVPSMSFVGFSLTFICAPSEDACFNCTNGVVKEDEHRTGLRYIPLLSVTAFLCRVCMHLCKAFLQQSSHFTSRSSTSTSKSLSRHLRVDSLRTGEEGSQEVRADEDSTSAVRRDGTQYAIAIA
ncbi:hypothetical protein AYL99_11734 [Fonsecaea erecta]|uniref:Uncharacterized protein n=1 Tax=Fonsecaea erecta TaxID=1367422 RepID=A0A178Z319_9EURO|nr:hypothetical protein AYL99_11734 [Fonsecaea erecta]OAP54199.1 hypothetical protein AYL99_11734 [Fonsecaea erecta]